MGAGKSTVAGELKDKLEMDRVEMDQMIVENQWHVNLRNI